MVRDGAGLPMCGVCGVSNEGTNVLIGKRSSQIFAYVGSREGHSLRRAYDTSFCRLVYAARGCHPRRLRLLVRVL